MSTQPGRQELSALANEVDSSLRAGRADQAARSLQLVNISSLPREFALRFANLCRRASLINLGLRILSPIVGVSLRRGTRSDASPAELAEYAVLLQKLGAIDEALATLRFVRSDIVPEASLYSAFCHFTRWEYKASVAKLGEYVANVGPGYMGQVGRVNLAAALINSGRFGEALELLGSMLSEKQQTPIHVLALGRLRGNCLELRAQIYVRQKMWSNAVEDLNEADSIFGPERTFDQLFVLKWRAIIRSFQSKSIAPIEAFRTEAVAREHWESVRESDLFALTTEYNEKKHLELHTGTPFAEYRERMIELLGRHAPRKSYLIGNPKDPFLNLSSGETSSGVSLEAGRSVHKTIAALARDLYRPLRIGALFSELFPGERFNVDSSPDRVHQSLWRTRQALAELEIPLQISQSKGYYRLLIPDNFGLLLSENDELKDANTLTLEQLKTKVSIESEFSAAQARDAIGLPTTSFHRFLTWALEKNLIVKYGAGRSTRYQFTDADEPERKAS